MSKDKQPAVKAKNGPVIDRRHNRTIPQGFALREPKWISIGHGIRKLRGPGNQTAYTALRGGKMVSITRKEVQRFEAEDQQTNLST